jgi:methanogenesis marker radical SAM protein
MIEVYAALVILPGINDGDELVSTIRWLEAVGVKGTILMRFANSLEQGLILENAPVISDQKIQSVEEFSDLVRKIKDITTMRISGTPLCDPDLGSPFILTEEPDLIRTLPEVSKRAGVITGSVAAPFITKILDARGGTGLVIPVKKEIADLITINDLKDLELITLPETIIIPGRAFVHIMEAEEVLAVDGIFRTVIRGPDVLTADGETSMGMTRDEVIALELDGFRSLINLINQQGI